MKEAVKWKNCQADVNVWRNGRLASAFLHDVVEPVLGNITARLNEWSESQEPAAAFIKDDIEALRRATMAAFCLSIQSMWERQIRHYIRDCARCLDPESKKDELAEKCNWSELAKLFNDLRGLSLADFEAYPDLDFLQLLANACRHGDGRSTRDLWRRHPELWDRHAGHRVTLAGGKPPSADMIEPRFEFAIISQDMLARFVGAIVSFWEEHEYFYLENLQSKHASVEEKLRSMRKARAKRSRNKNVDQV